MWRVPLALLTIIGPSGAGKTTIGKSLGLPLLASVTTRAPRKGEVPGVDYTFLNKNDFLKRRDNGYLVESVEYSGNYYGTDKRDVAAMVKSGQTHYVVVTYEGHEQLRKLVPTGSVVSVFVWAPKDQLAERMRWRGDSEELIAQRLAIYDEQMADIKRCDYVVPCYNYFQNIAIHRVRDVLAKHGAV